MFAKNSLLSFGIEIGPVSTRCSVMALSTASFSSGSVLIVTVDWPAGRNVVTVSKVSLREAKTSFRSIASGPGACKTATSTSRVILCLPGLMVSHGCFSPR